jgi:cell division protein FtsB
VGKNSEMSKIKLILAAILITGAVVACWLIKYQYDKITALEAKKTELEATIEKARADNVAANKQIKKLRQLKATDNETADWYNRRLPDSVLMLLQERYGKRN